MLDILGLILGLNGDASIISGPLYNSLSVYLYIELSFETLVFSKHNSFRINGVICITPLVRNYFVLNESKSVKFGMLPKPLFEAKNVFCFLRVYFKIST